MHSERGSVKKVLLSTRGCTKDLSIIGVSNFVAVQNKFFSEVFLTVEVIRDFCTCPAPTA
jgi:hypothetical protein